MSYGGFMKRRFKESVRIFLSGTSVMTAFVLTAFMLVSCVNEDTLEPHEISELYGYTFYGTITASGGNTLTPSLILYNNERADWNMNVGGGETGGAIAFYYYAVKNAVNNYTLYWFGGADYSAMQNKDKSKAVMVVQLGINSANEVVILLTGDGLTGIGSMQNTRVTMKKQESIPHNTEAPTIVVDPSIQDVTITVPGTATEADWGGSNSYTGSFDYLVGPGGGLGRGHGSCGTDSDGNPIIPKIGIDTGTAGSHKVKLKVHRFAYTQYMSIEAFEIPDVKVLQDGSDYYLTFGPKPVQAKRLNGTDITLKDVTVGGELKSGKLTLRVSFKPGDMPFDIVEVFKSE